MKLIILLLVFSAGAGTGIWWGVNHPVAATNIASQEEAHVRAAVAKAKIEVLDKVVRNQSAGSSPHAAEYQQMLNDQKNQFNEANKQLGQ